MSLENNARFILLVIGLVITQLSSLNALSQAASPVLVTVDTSAKTAQMSNGIVSLTINSKGQVNSLTYNNADLLQGGGRFYFSYNEAAYHELEPDLVKIGQQTDEVAEVIFVNNTGLFSIEQGFVMLKGISGVYTYVHVKAGSAAVNAREIRVVHRVSPTLFDWAYTSDFIQGPMVSVDALKNSTSIMDATYQLTDGSIYTKYDWANYVADDLVHGLVATSTNTGLWVVSASDEYLNGGPLKQELMVHGTDKTPLILKMLQGEHFGAKAQSFAPGEGKMYGPYFVYVNSASSKAAVINDAKSVANTEVNKWPYTWMNHVDYPLERTTVKGKIAMINGEPTEDLQVVLAKPGVSLYDQGKEYIYWADVDKSGNFSIPDVRADAYALYAFAKRGDVTDEYESSKILVNGTSKDLGTISWKTTKLNQLLWQIGQSDRKATEFNLGNVRRHYGIWDEVPANLTYAVGASEPSKDWYFGQTKKGTWKVDFTIADTLENVGKARLTVAIAGAASNPKVTILLNGRTQIGSLSLGNDGSVYRSANTGGRYELKTFEFSESSLRLGENTLTFQMTEVGSRGGLMYDVIKLEVPTPTKVIEPQPVLGIDINPSSFIYPNPVKDQLTVNLSSIGASGIEIINLLGQSVFKTHLEAGVQMMNLSHLPNGQYLVRLGDMRVEKLLIRH